MLFSRFVYCYSNENIRYSGWYTDLPGDDNLYKTAYYAMNTIDERLGGTGKLGYAKRRERGICIIGNRNKIG